MPKTAKVRLHLFTDPDFKITVPTRRQTVVSGGNATYRVESDGLGTYVDDTDLDVTGLPEGVDFSFAIDPIGYDASTNLTINTTQLSVGTHNFSIDAEIYTPPQDAIYADSPSLADVQAAIAAASPGQTVIVPAGSATWNSQLIITKGIRLIGAGSNLTHITAGFGTIHDYPIEYSPSSPALDEPFRLSGFDFDFNHTGTGLFLYVAQGYILHNIRIDHNAFRHATLNLIKFRGPVYGVADNNYFHMDLDQQAGDCAGHNQWNWLNENAEFGTANNFYFEDNVFDVYQQLAAGGQGNRYCFRYNTVNNSQSNIYMQVWDAHGSYWYGSDENSLFSPMVIEIYDNIIHGTRTPELFGHRGGMAVCYNNLVDASSSTCYIHVRNEYASFNTINPINSPNGEPKYVHKTYYWGNRDGSKIIPAETTESWYYPDLGRNVPVDNLDYWNEVASFDGSSGVGVGLLSARPLSCTLEGVGYWATDQNRLYRWHNGAWEVFYTPYTYPHPLRTLLNDTANK